MKAVLRELPALLPVAGFHAAGWALVAGCPALVPAAVAAYGPVPLVLGLPVLPVWWALLRALLAASGRHRHPLPESAPLGRDEAPGLWRTVTALAEAAGTPVPDRIRLTLRPAAFTTVVPAGRIRPVRRPVRRSPGRFLRRPRHGPAGSCLYLGVPLLAGLPPEELRAVLCRELAHAGRTHRDPVPAVRRGAAALRELREELRAAGAGHRRTAPWHRLQHVTLALCCRLHDLASLPARRRQDYAADALAAAVTGRRPAARSLAATALLAAAWEDFRTRFLDPMRRAGRVPDEPLRAFAAMLTDPDYEAGLAHWQESLPQTVPGLPRRLARLAAGEPGAGGAARQPAGPAPAGPVAVAPYGPAEPVPRTAWAHLLGTARPLPWQDWTDEAAVLHTHSALADLHDALGYLPRCTPTLNGVLDLLADGRHEELAAILEDTGWGERQWGELGEAAPEAALRALTGRGLAAAGRAGWVVSWLGPPRLVTYDSEAEEAVRLAADVLDDPTAVPRLRFLLTLSGVNLALPLDRPPGDWPPPEEHSAHRHPLHRGWYVAAGLAGVVLFLGYAACEPPRSPLSEPTAQEPVPEPSLSVPPAVRDDPDRTGPSPSPSASGCAAAPAATADGGCAGERPGTGGGSAPPEPGVVTVRAGDTLWALACRYRTTVEELAAVNRLRGTRLQPGQSLTLPAGAGRLTPAACD
ncbi:LysM peptidoglycan-binding domain-containing protein [Streptomyces sp. YIM 98790]|uniref:LysM peptidoglycan-binding domain-containing protein n=1 Tax=Streptomyces sp. YIM 98790 TaxID=2689077 RepID=UPI00140BB693|nr:LysM peptidoglycan-binding domain-containing protein [Streptomyces sp. YIM 98790]